MFFLRQADASALRKASLDALKKATIIRGGEYDPSEPVKRLRIAEGRASESYEDASAQDAMAKCEEAYANNADRWQDAHQPAILVKPCALKPAARFAQKMDALTARAPLVQPVMSSKKRRRAHCRSRRQHRQHRASTTYRWTSVSKLLRAGRTR